MNRTLHLDFETYATASLPDVGAYRYTLCPDFEVTVIAWAFDNDPVQSVVWPNTSGLPAEIMTHAVAGGEISAHNASFERAILTQHYTETVPPETMNCTMQRALVWGLPAGLLEAGRALRLSVLKDETEKKLMMAMAKPRQGGLPPWHTCDPARLARLEAYCRQDVEAERALAAALPELSGQERKVSLLDARSNEMGVLIDTDSVRHLKTAALNAHTRLNAEVAALTGGAIKNIGGETAKILAWVAQHGGVMPDLKKETVEAELENPTLPLEAMRLLELRQLGAKASIKKLDRMLMQAGLDNRARGALQYFGAGRTGRWAGRGIQVQNMPRPRPGIDVEATIRIAARDGVLDPLVYASPLAAISSCLRGCLIAKPGYVLVSLDLKQIEARVLAWLARQDNVLDMFRRGEDPYTAAAASVGSTDRTLGKVMTLGAGFGIGPAKFQYTAKTQYGLTLTLEEAERAVAGWRANNQRIVTFWWDMASEIKMALGVHPVIGNRSHGAPGGVRTVRRLKLRYDRSIPALKILKPNGEVMVYHRACVKADEIWYDGNDQKSKKWAPIRTYGGRFVENVTQAVARDVMADGLVRIEKALGLVPTMTVHDEAVYEVAKPDVENRIDILLQTEFERSPSWAPDLPVESEMKTGFRYGK